MDSDFPIQERIFILVNGDAIGPYHVDEILAKLERGEIDYDHRCIREGASETERLREILDWDETDQPAPIRQSQDISPENTPPESQDEEIAPTSDAPITLYQGHRSVLTFPFALFGLTGGIVAAIWLYPTSTALAILGIAVSVLSLAYISLTRYTQEYYINEKRVELMTGLFARSSKEVRVSDIRAVNVSCTGLKGIMGIGTIDFFTIGDDPEVSFADAWNAKHVKALVRKLQDALRDC